jgi:hypothetical protein
LCTAPDEEPEDAEPGDSAGLGNGLGDRLGGTVGWPWLTAGPGSSDIGSQPASRAEARAGNSTIAGTIRRAVSASASRAVHPDEFFMS